MVLRKNIDQAESTMSVKHLAQLQKRNEELESRVREISTLYRITRILGSHTDPHKALVQVASILNQVLSLDYFMYLTFGHEIQELHLRFAHGLKREISERLTAERIPFKERSTGAGADDGVNSGESLTGYLLACFKDRGYTDLLLPSFLSVPLIIEKEMKGIFCVGSRAGDAFGENWQGRFWSTIAPEVVSLYEKTVCLSRYTRLVVLGKMISEISHGFRHPVSKIKGTLQHLEGHWRDDTLRERSLEVLHNNISRLAIQVEELLHFSNPHRSQASLVNVNDTLAQVITLVRDELSQGNITLVQELADDLRPACINEEQMKEAFFNVIINAIEAMPHGGELRISSQNVLSPNEVGGNYILVKCTDTGIGISPAAQEMIFEHFYTTKESGTGLGLAAVKRIIESHHGSVSFQSKEKEGTTLRLYIPVQPRHDKPFDVFHNTV